MAERRWKESKFLDSFKLSKIRIYCSHGGCTPFEYLWKGVFWQQTPANFFLQYYHRNRIPYRDQIFHHYNILQLAYYRLQHSVDRCYGNKQLQPQESRPQFLHYDKGMKQRVDRMTCLHSTTYMQCLLKERKQKWRFFILYVTTCWTIPLPILSCSSSKLKLLILISTKYTRMILQNKIQQSFFCNFLFYCSKK